MNQKDQSAILGEIRERKCFLFILHLYGKCTVPVSYSKVCMTIGQYACVISVQNCAYIFANTMFSLFCFVFHNKGVWIQLKRNPGTVSPLLFAQFNVCYMDEHTRRTEVFLCGRVALNEKVVIVVSPWKIHVQSGFQLSLLEVSRISQEILWMQRKWLIRVLWSWKLK